MVCPSILLRFVFSKTKRDFKVLESPGCLNMAACIRNMQQYIYCTDISTARCASFAAVPTIQHFPCWKDDLHEAGVGG